MKQVINYLKNLDCIYYYSFERSDCGRKSLYFSSVQCTLKKNNLLPSQSGKKCFTNIECNGEGLCPAVHCNKLLLNIKFKRDQLSNLLEVSEIKYKSY